MAKIYLDSCCLNRPFDDQAQERIRLEAEAVLLILERIRDGSWEWISSDAVADEIDQIPDPSRRERVQSPKLVTGARGIELMNTRTMTLHQIQQTGLEVLSRELGPVGMVRFLQLFERGYGDYTAERHQWLATQTLDEVVRRIRQKEGTGPSYRPGSP